MTAHGKDFIRWLAEADVVDASKELVRRVVIVADVRGPVQIFVEKYGSTKILTVDNPFGGDNRTEVTVRDVADMPEGAQT